MRTQSLKLLSVLILAVTAIAPLAGCKKGTRLPPLVAPVVPRRSLDAQYTRLRIIVGEALDRTGLAGGVVDTGTTGGELRRTGGLLIAPPASGVQVGVQANATVQSSAAGSGSLSSVQVGGGALAQTIGAIMQSIAAVSERFEVVSGAGKGNCDLVLKTWVTGVAAGELKVDQVLESCDFGSAVSAVDGGIKYAQKGEDLQLDRDDVKRLLKKLIATLPEPSDMGKAQIIAREGRYVTLNMGKEHKVMKGMKAFAVSYGDRTVDIKSGITLGDEVFTGDLYVFAVYPKLARAWIVTEPADSYHDHSKVHVGDYVVFK
ncbi:MAG: hypothetical protein HY903_22945 [Deltaproteobacteria bacterium]|nr:hypothetical protein [Deltaproteobacteria bacterium]